MFSNKNLAHLIWNYNYKFTCFCQRSKQELQKKENLWIFWVIYLHKPTTINLPKYLTIAKESKH